MTEKKNDYSSLTLEEKIIMVEHLIVVHPQIQTVLDKIEYCRQHAKTALESVGLLVMGEKGTGKTTAKDICLSRNRVRQTETATVIPVLAIRIPVPASERGLTICLLSAMNDPYPNNGSIVAQTLRVYKLVEKCAVEVMIFDEFQHFAERDSFKLNRAVSDWTKNFMGETRLPMILFATPKGAEILDGKENEQLRRRFPFRIMLKPFGWKSKAEQSEFRKFLQQVDEKLPLHEYANLADPQMAARIHYATGGLMFEIMRLIRAAAIYALKRDLPKITLELLSESFIENLATNSPHLKNPFKA